VSIPKPDGRLRPLGSPTVTDRIVQTAALLVLEPIFEADFTDSSFGFRPGRNAHQAIDAIRRYLTAGLVEVYDADLKSYFDTIPHDQLLKCVERRLADRAVLRLIRMWLAAPVTETDDRGRTTISRTGQGVPQGGSLSPLLANIYLHWFEKAFARGDGPGDLGRRQAGAVRRRLRGAGPPPISAAGRLDRGDAQGALPADDQPGEDAHREDAAAGHEPGLPGVHAAVRPRPTRPGPDLPQRVPLGEVAGPCPPAAAGTDGPPPASRQFPELIDGVNRWLAGWGNYFRHGHPGRVFASMNSFVQNRLRRHLRRRSQRHLRPPEGMSFYAYMQRLGLRRLRAMRR
jgi:RNA-directed DNA polymerase